MTHPCRNDRTRTRRRSVPFPPPVGPRPAVPRWLLAFIPLVVALPTGLAGQETASERSGGGGGLCWSPRPLPECRAFLVFELSGQAPFAETARTVTVRRTTESPVRDSTRPIPRNDFTHSLREFGPSFAWGLGAGYNPSPALGVGGSVGLEFGHRDPRLSLEGRVRWWLPARGLSLEILPGLFRDLRGGERPSPQGHQGLSLGARIHLEGAGFLGVRYDRLELEPRTTSCCGEERIDPGGTQRALFVGFGLSERPAVWGTGALAAMYLTFMAFALPRIH